MLTPSATFFYVVGVLIRQWETPSANLFLEFPKAVPAVFIIPLYDLKISV